MEIFVAKFDYTKEREDILSFKEGNLFRIASKADSRWWAAYDVQTGDYGYIPSQYLEAYIDPVDGELAQKLAESSFGETKRVALEELKRTIPTTPAAASNGTEDSESSDDSSSDDESDEVVVIKPLTSLSKLPEDCVQITPKKLNNPHLDSKAHVKLRKELKLNNARGGASNLGKPELEKVMQRRRLDADGKPGPIKSNKGATLPNLRSQRSGDDELAAKLKRRTEAFEQAEKDAEKEIAIEQNKPEFLKISLRKNPVVQTS